MRQSRTRTLALASKLMAVARRGGTIVAPVAGLLAGLIAVAGFAVRITGIAMFDGAAMSPVAATVVPHMPCPAAGAMSMTMTAMTAMAAGVMAMTVAVSAAMTSVATSGGIAHHEQCRTA